MFNVFRKNRIFLRPNNGQYVDNKYVRDPSPALVEIKASLQPLTPLEMQQLPEGRRTNGSYKMYTDAEIRTVDEQNPDEIIIGDRVFEVIGTNAWQNNIINHNKVIIAATNRKYVPPSP